VVRIDKPLDGQRVCRNCIAKSRIEEFAPCVARRKPVTREAGWKRRHFQPTTTSNPAYLLASITSR
jgi:hypothetical protein